MVNVCLFACFSLFLSLIFLLSISLALCFPCSPFLSLFILPYLPLFLFLCSSLFLLSSLLFLHLSLWSSLFLVSASQWERQFLGFPSLLISMKLTMSVVSAIHFFGTIHTTCALLTTLLDMVYPAGCARKLTFTSGTSCYLPFCKRRLRKDSMRGQAVRLATPGCHLSGTTRFLESGMRLEKRNGYLSSV